MAVTLYAHNDEAYKKAMSMLDEKGKAAVIHPTGTGKSFIGFKLAEDHPDRRVCWLAPSDYIFRTQVENLRAAGGSEPENILFYTYARMMMMTEEEAAGLRSDYIILDEFHRCGARKWGGGVQKLLEAYPQAKVLGLSATHIRYLDGQRDMADELFGGNVASEMTLGEAIVRGILGAPRYVLSVYAWQKDLKKYEARVRNARSRAVRDEAEKYLEALRRALDKADGLDAIFEKHMPDRAGRYIVFCANVEHLYEMEGHVPEWFRGIDKEPHVYSVYADSPQAGEEFTRFKEDASGHLKLLFCVDMLNEGIHVEGVDGVILLRPTVSPTIYKQQVGRAFSAGNKKNCVVFDVVMNIENLYSAGEVQEEMQEAISWYRHTGQGQYIVNERFRLYDELQDCRVLFGRLEGCLGASWETMYKEAEKYYQQYGHLEVPRRYKTEEGYALGDWVFTQRRVRAGLKTGMLTDVQVERLDAIGMVWESLRDLTWERNFAEARQWSEAHGDLNVPVDTVTETGFRLGSWIGNLRVCRKYGTSRHYLTEERIKALDAIGMVWDAGDALWERNYAAAKVYYGAHGNLEVPATYKTTDGICLGTWVRNLRDTRKAMDEESGGSDRQGGRSTAPLTEVQVKALDAIGMVWTPPFERKWEQGFREAEAYYEINGDLKVPVKYMTGNGFRLGRWVRRQRDARESLSRSQAARLNAIGMEWQNSPQAAWEEQYEDAARFYRQHGHLRVPEGYRGTSGKKLGGWVAAQRKKGRSGKLTEAQAKKLYAIGIAQEVKRN